MKRRDDILRARVNGEDKARWAEEAKADGISLTDLVIRRMNAVPMVPASRQGWEPAARVQAQGPREPEFVEKVVPQKDLDFFRGSDPK